MLFNTMLIGMDFSEAAIKAATWASQHFAPSAQVTLVHVIDPPDRPVFGRHLLPLPETIEADARDYARRRLREIAASLTPNTPWCEIRVGKPHHEITTLARDIGADLIVVGPHGDRPRPRKFLGTTAERIVRSSPVPVLVATNPPASRPRNVLVPVDELAITPTLLEWTRALAEDFDASVTLLHVWSNAIYSHVASMSYATSTNDTEARRAIHAELGDAAMHWLEEIARAGVKRDRVTTVVTAGKPGDATVEQAAAMHADLIMLGRRGSGLVAPALLGSTVGTVLHGSTCPVLVIIDSGDEPSEP
jgi:nucleotide-binding universal stress UspA family protein